MMKTMEDDYIDNNNDDDGEGRQSERRSEEENRSKVLENCAYRACVERVRCVYRVVKKCECRCERGSMRRTRPLCNVCSTFVRTWGIIFLRTHGARASMSPRARFKKKKKEKKIRNRVQTKQSSSMYKIPIQIYF